MGVPGILNDGDDVGALLGNVEEIATGAVRELDGVDQTLRADKVGHVRDGGARGGTEVQNLEW